MAAVRWIGYGLALLFAGALVFRFAVRPTGGEEIAALAEEVARLEVAAASAGSDRDLGAEVAALRETVAELLYELDRLAEEIPAPTEGEAGEADAPGGISMDRIRERIAKIDEEDRRLREERDPNAPPLYGTPEWREEMRRLTQEAQKAQVDWLGERFELADGQKKEMLDILNLWIGRSQSIHERVKSHDATIRTMRAEILRIRTERDDALKNVLTEEQFEEFKKIFPDPPDPLADDPAGGGAGDGQ